MASTVNRFGASVQSAFPRRLGYVTVRSVFDCKISAIGLGYVGLPLAVEFGKRREVVSFDNNDGHIAEFRGGNDVHNPWADPAEAAHEYGLELAGKPEAGAYDGLVIAVPHDGFRGMGGDAVRALGRDDAVVYDLKVIFSPEASDIRL